MQPFAHITKILRTDEPGTVAAEYAILVSGIAIAIFVAVGLFGGAVQGLYQNVVDKLPK